jgi:hypothetical protein
VLTLIKRCTRQGGKGEKMGSQSTLQPILSEQSLLFLAAGIFALAVIAGVCFTIILRKDASNIKSFRGGRILHYVTVLVVVFASILLALERILSGEAVATILGGIIGYVLGTLRERPQGD